MSFDPTASTSPARWQKLAQSTQFTTPIFALDHARYRHPRRGTERDFVVINSPDWVNVIAVTPNGGVVLVRQFRYGIDAFSVEIPGGVMDAGEDPIEAGLRELREETGYAGVRARLLGSVHPNPAFQSNRAHFVLVEAVTPSHELEWDADEEIEVRVEPIESVLEMARNGGITHSLVLNALMFFEREWQSARSG